MENMSAEDVSQSLSDAIRHSQNSYLLETADERRAQYEVFSSRQQAYLTCKRNGYMYSSAIEHVPCAFRSARTSKGGVA